ncbi:desiccation-related protein PCC13-62-like [Hibiscus syriacus]|uniref:desiccation-related protein PCC13-62-like n=1 Tax=Hibiscus syriacus TaxID=106335 RepID=UPI0019246934|nr:desiccation-related protein PCC13-62-like [Hibiscus syriacus]
MAADQDAAGGALKYKVRYWAIVNRTLPNAPLERPQINLSAAAFAMALNARIYARISLSLITQYEGANAITPLIIGTNERQLLDGIARYNAAEYEAINALLFQNASRRVPPTTLTVGNLTNITAEGVNLRGRCGAKDEGLIVPLQQGAENRTITNVVQGDVNSLSFTRTEREVLRISFATGNATRPGALLPNGVNGTVFRLIQTLFRSVVP